jgi:hypothetical protein
VPIRIEVERVEDFDRLLGRSKTDCECNKKKPPGKTPCGGAKAAGPAAEDPQAEAVRNLQLAAANRRGQYWQAVYGILTARGFAAPLTGAPLEPAAMAAAVGQWLDGRHAVGRGKPMPPREEAVTFAETNVEPASRKNGY